MNYVLGQRGQVGSMKGRPTNFAATYKGTFSNSSRAIQQRNLAALRSVEDQHLTKAHASDRAAKKTLKQKLNENEAYLALSDAEKKTKFEEEFEKLSEQRYRTNKSGKLSHSIITFKYLLSAAEWLENSLQKVHKKWANIQFEIDMRKHEASLMKVGSGDKTSGQGGGSRVEKALFSAGGTVEKLQRKIYEDGLHKLKTNSFADQQEKTEWEDFRDSLTPEELATVSSEQWQ